MEADLAVAVEGHALVDVVVRDVAEALLVVAVAEQFVLAVQVESIVAVSLVLELRANSKDTLGRGNSPSCACTPDTPGPGSSPCCSSCSTPS